jgi:hypothetical protein
MANKDDVTRALLGLQHLANSPIKDTNVSKIVAQYQADLEDLPADILHAAVVHYRTSPSPFFPTSGQLREKATELLLLAMDVPTAAQAWAQVLEAPRLESVVCNIGNLLYQAVDTASPDDYWTLVMEYKLHCDKCDTCKTGVTYEHYDHPIVARVVKKLGGRERILTDNLPADRAQFIRAYMDIVMRETKKATMPKQLKNAVDQIAAQQMALLTEGMER